MRNLFAATEAVGNDERIRVSVADCGKKNAFPDRLRKGVFIFLKAEGTGHAATAGVRGDQVGTHFAEERFFVIHLHDCFVMAMAVEQHFSSEARRLKGRGVALEEFAEEECLAAEAICARVIGKQVAQFVAKNGGATGLEDDDGDAGINLRAEGGQDALQVLLGFVEHAEIVKGAAAAKMLAGDADVETCALQNVESGLGRPRMEIDC